MSSNYLYFASGCNRVPDMLGMADAGHAVGVSVPRLSASAIRHLCYIAVPVFLDTGAFSEVEAHSGGLRVVSPILDHEWTRRLEIMLDIARAHGTQCTVVAPDRIGCQDTTLARMRRFAPLVRALQRTGARLVVALQRGPRDPARFMRQCSDALEFPLSGLVAGIPSNKAAMPASSLASLLRDVQPASIHLLGMGPRNPRFNTRLALCRDLVPDIEVSCDSNAIAAVVGHGRAGSSARPLTMTQYLELRRAEDMTFSDYAGIDYTDELAWPSQWLTGTHLATFIADIEALGMRVDGDLDAWVRKHWDNQWVAASLDRAWESSFRRRSRPAARRVAVAHTFAHRDIKPENSTINQLKLKLS